MTHGRRQRTSSTAMLSATVALLPVAAGLLLLAGSAAADPAAVDRGELDAPVNVEAARARAYLACALEEPRMFSRKLG